MTTWASRAKAHFQKTPPPPTDKTDKRGVSSVSSVPAPHVFEQKTGLSSVSSVPTPHVFEKTTPLDDRTSCPACTHFHPIRKQCLNYRRAGLTEPSVAAAIAHLPQRCPGHTAKP